MHSKRSRLAGIQRVPIIDRGETHALLGAVGIVFAQHRPLVLSPDAVWLTIAQGVAQPVRLHAEALRSRLSRTAAASDSRVEVPACRPISWSAAVSAFRDQLAGEIGDGRVRRFECDFSTSTEVDRIAARSPAPIPATRCQVAPAYGRGMNARRVLVMIAAGWLAGCGSRCPEIAATRRALVERTAIAPGPHVEVRSPLDRANAFIAELLRDQPLAVPIELPGLGLALSSHELTAVAREVRVRPALPDRIRFAIRIEIEDAQQPVTTLAVETEVTPTVARGNGITELVTGFGPENLIAVTPELGPRAERALGDAIARWLPPVVRDRLPRSVLDRGARELASYLTGRAYRVLQATLLRRLGEVTRLRLRLPDLPIASATLRSSATPTEALTIDLATDLPVRRGLTASPPAGDEVMVRLSGSTATELANWAIERGHLPQHYTRSLEPKPDGEYRPYVDYLATDRARPVKIHVFQDRGGCSYFQVGLRLEMRIIGDKLEVSALDRIVESADASVPIEIALWLKQLIQGSVDRSRQAAAHTQLTVGGRSFTTRAVRAAVVDDELQFELQFSSVAPPQATFPVVR